MEKAVSRQLRRRKHLNLSAGATAAQYTSVFRVVTTNPPTPVASAWTGSRSRLQDVEQRGQTTVDLRNLRVSVLRPCRPIWTDNTPDELTFTDLNLASMTLAFWLTEPPRLDASCCYATSEAQTVDWTKACDASAASWS